jgi:hypothetical protein
MILPWNKSFAVDLYSLACDCGRAIQSGLRIGILSEEPTHLAGRRVDRSHEKHGVTEPCRHSAERMRAQLRTNKALGCLPEGGDCMWAHSLTRTMAEVFKVRELLRPVLATKMPQER